MSYPGTEKPPQQLTRIPVYRPGMWVVVELDGAEYPPQVRRVRSVTCALVGPEHRVRWWVHFEDGRQVSPRKVLRLATEDEIRRTMERRCEV